MKWLLIFIISSSIADEFNLDKIQSDNKIPAMGLLLFENGMDKFYQVNGKRKLGNDTNVSKEDKFHLGSCSKSMTAVLIAKLVESGKLRWDMTLDEIFPEYKIADDDVKGVTVDMLLAHRSGIISNLLALNGGKVWKKVWSFQEGNKGRNFLLKKVFEAPLDAKPKSKFIYSNTGYVILGSIIDKIAGTSWEDYIEKNLFKPLKMDSCGVGAAGDPNSKNPDQPWPHRLVDTNPVPVKPDLYGDNPVTIAPAGGVHCSLQDWKKFVRAHIDGFNGKDNVILAKSYRHLHEPYPDQKYTYGGWFRIEKKCAKGPVFTHSGSNTMNFAKVNFAPKLNLGVLGVTNFAGDLNDSELNYGDRAISKSMKKILKKLGYL